MDDKEFRAWKHFQDRADKIKDGLWSRMTWVLTIYGAIIAYLTNDKIKAVVLDADSFFRVCKPELAIGIGWFGVFLSTSTIFMFYDGLVHIQSNWSQSQEVRGDTVTKDAKKSMRDAICRFYKKHINARVPLYIVACINIIAFVGFVWLIFSA